MSINGSGRIKWISCVPTFKFSDVRDGGDGDEDEDGDGNDAEDGDRRHGAHLSESAWRKKRFAQGEACQAGHKDCTPRRLPPPLARTHVPPPQFVEIQICGAHLVRHRLEPVTHSRRRASLDGSALKSIDFRDPGGRILGNLPANGDAAMKPSHQIQHLQH